MLSTSFSSPASANRVYFVARNLTFAQDQQPSKADMIKEVMGKYGMPTIVGDQHLYYIYRGGSIVSVGGKYKEATALEAIDKPLDPKAAVKLNGDTVRGSCVAVVKRAQAKAKELTAMMAEAKGANCEGGVERATVPGTPRRSRQHRAIHPARRQTGHQRGGDRQRGARDRAERAVDADGQHAQAHSRLRGFVARTGTHVAENSRRAPPPRPRAAAVSSPCRWRCAAADRVRTSMVSGTL